MSENEHLGVVDAAQRNAEKIADANVDRHLHAVQGTAQNDAFAMKFYIPHAAVRAGIVRVEADRQRERVEPQCAARPGGIVSAWCWLWAPRFFFPAGFLF